ncbi:MAG: hypothetical protein HQ542_03010, partial [Bacteroidia bacterium]|nr:hypothetical protein [Bacteroidia bacterium]
YYAAAALTDSLLEATHTFDPLTSNDLPEKYIQLMEINRIVRIIGNHRFGEQLSLQKNDPVQFAEKFLRLDKFSRSATMTFKQHLEDPTPLAWTGSLTDLSKTYILHLISYIQKSMLINGIRGGIYSEYVDSYFLITGFNNEEGIYSGLIKKMFPSEYPALAASSISRVVWEAYLQAARKLTDESNYVAALVLLEHAGSFREHIPHLELPDFIPLQVEAVKGIYASYLGIAESCIDLQKFQMAEDYITQAGEYLADFEGIIPADTMFQRVFRKLFKRRLQGCDYILGVRQFQEALDCYQLFTLSYPPEMIAYVEDHLSSRRQQAFKGLFQEERERVFTLMLQRQIDSALICYDNACGYQELIMGDPEVIAEMDELDNRMLPVRYKQLADRGTYLYMTYNHEEAFRTFNRMKEVGELLGMPVDTALDRMYLESYKHHMLNEISMATGMIWKDELEMAKEYAREVESVMDLYNLEMDPDLQSALSSYRQKIDLKICLSVKEAADILAIRAWQNIEMQQFDRAVKLLGEARQKTRQHPECQSDLQAFDDTIKKYISAAFYQEKLQQALHQVALGNFREAIQRVNDNELFYRNTQLANVGVPFTSTIDFVALSLRVPMYLEAVPFFLQSGDVTSAWSCLTWLKREGVDASDVRELQATVGSALAIRDFEILPEGDPEDRFRNYTGGNRWFIKFAQAYTARWRQLQTEQSLKTP